MAIKEASVTSTSTTVTRGSAGLPGVVPCQDDQQWKLERWISMPLITVKSSGDTASSQQDPEVQSYYSPMPTFTQQHPAGPHKSQGRALAMANPAVGMAGSCLHGPQDRNPFGGAGGSLQAPNPACSSSPVLAPALCDVLRRGWSRAATGSDASARALPGACSSGISAQVPRQAPLAHPRYLEARPQDSEPGENGGWENRVRHELELLRQPLRWHFGASIFHPMGGPDVRWEASSIDPRW